jgi:hypothetical protein
VLLLQNLKTLPKETNRPMSENISEIWSPCSSSVLGFVCNAASLNVKIDFVYGFQSRVARFFFVQHTKIGKVFQITTKYTKAHKIYQMAVR